MRHVTRIGPLVLVLWLLCAPEAMAGEADLRAALAGRRMLVTYREGEAVFGTYFFVDVHYCASGRYVTYGRSVKQTVLGNEQRNAWEVRGTWRVTTQEGATGVWFRDAEGGSEFVPVKLLVDGTLFVRDGVTLLPQGPANCSS